MAWLEWLQGAMTQLRESFAGDRSPAEGISSLRTAESQGVAFAVVVAINVRSAAALRDAFFGIFFQSLVLIDLLATHFCKTRICWWHAFE
jgi:hypothetical protein